MKEVDTALSQIASIRAHLLASTRFLGIEPSSNILTGGLALVLAAWQENQPALLEPLAFVRVWTCFIVAISILATARTCVRTRRVHGDMAMGMLGTALQKVLPFFAAGIVISQIVCHYAMDSIWLLPGLWLMLIGLVGFSVVSIMPPGILWPSVWFFVSGAVVMALAAQTESFSSWMLAIPFSVGQMSIALILTKADEKRGVCE